MKRYIMHIDMDAFFASVEQLDNPELRGKALIVGGLSGRGVVSTCSYEARKFGVHSAMPMAEARKLCPHAEFLPGRMWRYKEVSNQIMAIFQEEAPLVEQLSIDEAFLDVTGMERLCKDVRNVGWHIKERIKNEIGLTCSVGLAPNKFLAKMASDLQKPDGFTVIAHEDARNFIAPLPVTKIFGIGGAAQQSLAKFGITTIGQLANADRSILQKVFGKNADKVQHLAMGLDDRPVVPETAPKSIGRETTFEKDLYTYEDCKGAILELSGQTGYRLRNKGYSGRTVTLKVKFKDFKTITRSISSESDISCDEEIFALAVKLLREVNYENGVRLLGVTVSHLQDGSCGSLCFEENTKLLQRNATIDNLKKRFGENIIHRGGRHS
ncbi:MAG: DNA polymerase IV [Phascolarctobacterium sp.]|nr:DNA polymerase IV [Phascolarctobacterium sp.]